MRHEGTEALALARAEARAGKTSPLEREVVALFDLYRERLLRYLLGFGLPVQDGEEIVQEVFLALFQHLRKGKSRENLRGWVFRVAHNLGLKRRAAMGRTEAVDATIEMMIEALIDPEPNPEAQCATNQQQRRLEAVLNALPEQDRRCLALRAEGLRYREIGEVLNMSLGAVSISLSRSLARMTRVVER